MIPVASFWKKRREIPSEGCLLLRALTTSSCLSFSLSFFRLYPSHKIQSDIQKWWQVLWTSSQLQVLSQKKVVIISAPEVLGMLRWFFVALKVNGCLLLWTGRVMPSYDTSYAGESGSHIKSTIITPVWWKPWQLKTLSPFPPWILSFYNILALIKHHGLSVAWF